jgi:cell wall assembly regulator SMI1
VSIRVDGQSRQKFIAVIGSFVAERLDVEARRDFWKAAHERLSTYVHDDDRSKIEAELARRVPPLTTEEVEAHDRQRKQRDQGVNEPTASAAAGPYLDD